MTRALCTFADANYERILSLTRPRMQEYAARHGYDYHEGADPWDRQPSWWKIPLLIRLLGQYDEVLYIDSDIVIVDGSQDIAALVPPDKILAMVRHHTPDGEVPNAGLLYCRKPMLPWLAKLWTMEEYKDHVWLEQAALLTMLGYRHDPRPSMLLNPTDLYRQTQWLPLEWNSHEQNDRHPSPRFAHVTPNSVEWRLPILKRYLAQSEPALVGLA